MTGNEVPWALSLDERFADVLASSESDSDSEDDASYTHADLVPSTPTQATSTSAASIPLYEGSSLSVSASNLLIMQFKQRYQIPKEAVGDLLHLLQLHCPTPNKWFSFQ